MSRRLAGTLYPKPSGTLAVCADEDCAWTVQDSEGAARRALEVHARTAHPQPIPVYIEEDE